MNDNWRATGMDSKINDKKTASLIKAAIDCEAANIKTRVG
jgi:hypothetical protein